jgi:hypothetical protein
MSIQGLEMPKFVGFWVEELFAPSRVEYRKVNLKGVQYNVAQLYSGALFPTKTGELFLDPMKVKCNVTVKNKKRRKSIWNDPFFDSFSRQQTVPKVLLTEKTLINVKPYPEGKPADFTGAVGSFTLAAFADMKSVKTNEAITLKVKLQGTGNISMFSLPEFDFPQTLEVFPPTSTIKKEPLRDNITGSVSWEYILIPRQEGRFIIPRIELPFFDSKTEEWNRTSTRPIQISVLPGETFAEVSSGLTKEEVVLLGSDIRYIRREIPQWIYRKYSGLSFEILTLYGLSLIFFISPGFMKNIQRNKGGTEDILGRALHSGNIFFDNKNKKIYFVRGTWPRRHAGALGVVDLYSWTWRELGGTGEAICRCDIDGTNVEVVKDLSGLGAAYYEPSCA